MIEQRAGISRAPVAPLLAQVLLYLGPFYVTFVAVPVCARYAVVPVVLVGFLPVRVWQRVTAAAVSLALGWESLFLAYPPTGGYPGWEVAGHQLSHLALVGVVLYYLARRLRVARARLQIAPALVTRSILRAPAGAHQLQHAWQPAGAAAAEAVLWA